MMPLVCSRVLLVIIMLLGLSTITFGLTTLTPGDPVTTQLLAELGRPPSTAEVVERRAELGLDRPAPARYVTWLGDVVRGDLGTSLQTRRPVVEDLRNRLPATLLLATTTLLAVYVIGVPLGIVSAVYRGRWFDHLVRGCTRLLAGVPAYLAGYILMLVFAVHGQVLPVSGRDGMASLVLPALTLGFGPAIALIRLVRQSAAEVLDADFVRVARAKGLTEQRVMRDHVVRVIAVPLLTMAGLRLAALLGGAVVVESVFAWPGLGSYAVSAVLARDYPLIQGYVLFIGIITMLTGFAIDVIAMVLDPRSRGHHAL